MANEGMSHDQVAVSDLRTLQNLHGTLGQFLLKSSFGSEVAIFKDEGAFVYDGLVDIAAVDMINRNLPVRENVVITAIELFGADLLDVPADATTDNLEVTNDDLYVQLIDGTYQSLCHYRDIEYTSPILGRFIGVYIGSTCATGVSCVCHLGWMQP